MTRKVAVAFAGAAIAVVLVGHPASAKSKPKTQQGQTLCSSNITDTQRSELEQQIRDLQAAGRITLPTPQFVYPIVRCGPGSSPYRPVRP